MRLKQEAVWSIAQNILYSISICGICIICMLSTWLNALPHIGNRPFIFDNKYISEVVICETFGFLCADLSFKNKII